MSGTSEQSSLSSSSEDFRTRKQKARASILSELRRRKAKTDLGAWCEHALAPFGQAPAAHHRLLIRELEAIASGANDRLIVTMPPGSAKSTYASVLFPAWLLAQRPRLNIIGASHTADLAESFSRKIMGTIRDHSETLGYGLVTESVGAWITTTGGEYKAAGVGGPITGRRADCLTGETVIRTPLGTIKIEDYVGLADKPCVLSYNHETGCVEYRPVLASRVIEAKEIVEVRTAGGLFIRSTANHRHFVPGRGYVHAGDLECGDGLLSSEGISKSLPKLRRTKEPTGIRQGLPSLPLQAGGHTQQCDMRGMRQDIPAASLRSPEGSKERLRPELLQPSLLTGRVHQASQEELLRWLRQSGLQGGSPALQGLLPSAWTGRAATVRALLQSIRDAARRTSEGHQAGKTSQVLRADMCQLGEGDPQGLRTLRAAGTKKDDAVLHDDMQSRQKAGAVKVPSGRVPGLRERLPPANLAAGILLSLVCRSRARRAHVWGGKFPLHAERKLQPTLPGNAPTGSSAGRLRLPSLRSDGGYRASREAHEGSQQPAYAPHRREPEEQSPGKSRNPVRGLPPQSPQLDRVVSVTRRVCDQGIRVYDIQVEGNGNFFAGEILVHNCAIVDDPVKSRSDAESPTYRDRAWSWYLADLSTRLKPRAAIVLIMTRWHADDLGGRLLEAQSARWRTLSLPARAVENDPLGRAPGEWLWSDDDYGYGADLQHKLHDYETSGGMRDWWALYEQSPRILDGGIFKTAMLGTADAAPVDLGTTVRAWDLAATAETGSRDADYTVGVKLAKTAAGGFIVLDVVRFRGGPDEVEAAIKNTADRDGRSVTIGLPQDPGQAGKSQLLYLTRRLAGFKVEGSPESGDKAERAMPFAAQTNVGNVALLRANWNAAFVDELSGFPSASHDDIVDAASRAFSMLVAPPAPAHRINAPLRPR